MIQRFLYLQSNNYVMHNTNIEDLRYLFEKIKTGVFAHKPMLQVINDSIILSYIKYDELIIRYVKGCIAIYYNNQQDKINAVCFSTHELFTHLKCYDNGEIIDDENNDDK